MIKHLKDAQEAGTGIDYIDKLVKFSLFPSIPILL
jgi:hypothetical protein